MGKGSASIPVLHLTYLNGLIDYTKKPVDTYFSNLFPTRQYPSDQIEWETIYGSVGMTPFIAPGSISPTIGGDGIGHGSAYCAFMAEKSFIDEVMLNNLRMPGTDRTYMTAKDQLVRRFNKLRNRCIARREWMVAKMITEGAITYQNARGMKVSVSYGIPTQNLITLTGNDVWGTGSTRNPAKTMFTVHELLSDEYGYKPSVHMMNSATMKLLMFDANVQDLLKNSAFGGSIKDLSGPAAMQAIAVLLGIGNLIVNDSMFEVEGWLTANVTGGSTTTVYVEDASDFESGGKLRFINSLTPNTWETKTISSVNKLNNTVTVSAAPTYSYTARRDRVVMRKKYIADNKIIMLNPVLGNESIAEIMEAPHGLDRRWGMSSKTWDDNDPEGTWMKIEDKCFPVLTRPEAVAVLTVA